MNYPSYTTLISWETRNWRHREQALKWCKDYGFKPVTKHTFIGDIYEKEREELRAKFASLFISKTERFFFVALCKTCFNESMIEAKLSEKLSRTSHFELIQMPENG